MNPPQSSFFIIRAVDAFGDSWPLASLTSGIDGKRHDSMGSAKAFIASFKADKTMRKALREQVGWQANTLRRLEVSEVTIS